MSQKPKRPQNAFFLYKKHHSEDIKQRFDCKNSREVTVKAAELWNQESIETKSEFEAKAKELSIEFKANNPNFSWKRKNLSIDVEQQAVQSPISPLPSPYLNFRSTTFTPQIDFYYPQFYSPATSYISPSASIHLSPQIQSIPVSPSIQMITSRMEDISMVINPESLLDPQKFKQDFCLGSCQGQEIAPTKEQGFDSLMAGDEDWL